MTNIKNFKKITIKNKDTNGENYEKWRRNLQKWRKNDYSYESWQALQGILKSGKQKLEENVAQKLLK